VPLRSDLHGIGERILDFYARGSEPPYLLYVYPPSDEWSVRRDLKDLQLWLEAPDQGVRCAAISLADLFWQSLEAEGWIDELVSQERDAAGDQIAQRELYRAVGEILRVPPSLPERVLAAVDDLGDEPTAVFLYRAGALYPAYRTSTLIDDLRSRLRLPVTLLYPGVIVGDYGLKFMGRTEPAYGYRALIVPRGGHS
jgi:hypothetical protein